MTSEECYNKFVEKFEPKKTTDDCYTPANIMDAVNQGVCREYGVDAGDFVRPFYPGGDYERFDYSENCIVVDNPPFSILSKIVAFYSARNIRFFLFAPTLTLFSSSSSSSCAIAVGVGITYANGAKVNTSFLTNLEENRLRSAPELYRAINAENDKNQKAQTKQLPKYRYPDHIVTSTFVAFCSKHGIDFSVSKADSLPYRALDAQREKKKTIFGNGYLLSEKAAAEKAAAETWELSARERKLVQLLSSGALADDSAAKQESLW